MADVGLRDLGAFVPGGRSPRTRGQEPAAPPLPPQATDAAEPPPVIITPPPAPAKPVFGSDLPVGADALGIDDTLGHLAELAAHRGTAAPLVIGLLGAPGAGKSFALQRLSTRIRDLTAAAGATAGPFLARVHVQAVDAASLEGDPATGLAATLHAGLRQPYPDLAREISHAARDPHVVLRETNEKLDEARRRLDSERRALDDAGSRRARLTEAVLYEAAGSQVDAYARANRASIESRLAGFGITGDPIRNYKDLVQLVAGSGGKVGLSLRSLWAYKGQTKLIVAAIVLAAIGIGLGIAIDDQATWLGDLRSGPQTGTSVANWFQAHMSLLGTAKSGAFLLAALAILANLWRAFAFVQPVFKGARLLDSDLDNRRRDLDGLYAHQTKRVDTLGADVERLTRESAEAERRVGGAALNEPSPFESPTQAAQAQRFFTALATMVGNGKAMPQRIVLAVDHLDAVAPERARGILDRIHRLSGSGIVAVVAADPGHLWSEHRSDLERWIQVPVRLDAGAPERDYGALVDAALGRDPAPLAAAKPDATQSALDAPVDDDEAALLSALAELAGPSPRAIKRFVNLYKLARLDGSPRGPLALMLALAQGGSSDERAAVASAIAESDPAAPFDLPTASARLRAALAAIVAADRPFNVAEARRAVRRAALFSI